MSARASATLTLCLVLASCRTVPPPSQASQRAPETTSTAAPPPEIPMREAPPPTLIRVIPKDLRIARPAGHLSGIQCLSFSSDGRELVSGSADGSVLVWDLETGEVVQRLERHIPFVPANACAFLPDGKRIVTAEARGRAVVFNRATGVALRQFVTDPLSVVRGLAISPNGREVMVGMRSGRVAAWDLRTGDRTFFNEELVNNGFEEVWAVGYLPDGHRFAGGAGSSERGRFIVWEGASRRELDTMVVRAEALSDGRLVVMEKHGVTVLGRDGKHERVISLERSGTGLAVDKTHGFIVAGGYSGHAGVYSTATWAERCHLPQETGILAAAIDPSGLRFAVGGEGGNIVVAEASNCTIVATLGGSRARVSTVAAAQDLALGDAVGNISTWVTAEPRAISYAPAHEGEVVSIASVGRDRWVSAGMDLAVLAGGTRGYRQLGKTRVSPTHVLTEPSGRAVLVFDMTGEALEFPVSGGLARTAYKSENDAFLGGAFRPGGSELVLSGWGDKLEKRDFERGIRLSTWPVAGTGVSTLAYSPDGLHLAEGSTWGDVAVRSPVTGTIEQKLEGLSSWINRILYAGEFLWAGGYDQKLVRWSPRRSAQPDRVVEEDSAILDLAVTHDGNYLVAALNDGAALYKLPDGELVARLFPFRDGSWATVYPDGRAIASSGAAMSMVFQDPVTRRTTTLAGAPTGKPLTLTTPVVQRKGVGPARIHATVISDTGRPLVRLDDRWDLVSVTPNHANLAVYDVDFFLDDAAGSTHEITVVAPEGGVVKRNVSLPASTPLVATKAVPPKAQKPALEMGITELTASLLVEPSDAGRRAELGMAWPLGIEVRVRLAGEVEWVRGALYTGAGEPGKRRAEVESLRRVGKGKQAKKGEPVVLVIPIGEDLRHGRFLLEVQACGKRGACEEPASAGMAIEF